MPFFSTANLIASVSPGRYVTNVDNGAHIVVEFFRDIDQSTLGDSTISLEVVGTVTRVPITYSYANKVLTITPTGGLQPSTRYKLTLVGDTDPQSDVLTSHITGIRDIIGNGFIGVYTTEFVTSDSITPTDGPILSMPVNESSILTQPNFVWLPVSGAITYQIQVALQNTFENIYWPTTAAFWTTNQLFINPDKTFDLSQEYWWRVRGVSNSGSVGPWSAPSTFYYGDPSLGVVTPDDISLGDIFNTQQPLTVLYASPTPGASNLPANDYPQQIKLVLSGQVDASTVVNGCISISAEAVDGTTFDANQFTPIFSPSLNGSQFGSGGITAEQAVDEYQRIYVSPPLRDLAVAYSYDGNNTILTADVPASYWNNNNIYTVTLDIAQLQNPISYSFSSAWTPLFAGVRAVRSTTDHFMPGASDDEILFHIRDASLEALRIQVYPPTQLDGMRWVYNPPISFNINNPPYFVRKFVEITTSMDLLNHYLTSLLGQGKTTLGDFETDKQTMSLKQNIQFALQNMEEELRPYLDQLHGLTNRGYARGEWAQRGDRNHVNTQWGYPFGSRPRGTTF